MTISAKKIIAFWAVAGGLVVGTVKVMDAVHARREQIARLEEKVKALEAENAVYVSIMRARFALTYAPVAPVTP